MLFAGGPDGNGSIGMRNDVQAIGIKLWRVTGIEFQAYCLTFDAIANGPPKISRQIPQPL